MSNGGLLIHFGKDAKKKFSGFNKKAETLWFCHLSVLHSDLDSGCFDRLDGSSILLNRWLLLCRNCRWQLLLWLITLHRTQGQKQVYTKLCSDVKENFKWTRTNYELADHVAREPLFIMNTNHKK